MVQEYEDNIIPPPFELRDGWKPTPTPRRKKMVVPVAASRTKIWEKLILQHSSKWARIQWAIQTCSKCVEYIQSQDNQSVSWFVS